MNDVKQIVLGIVADVVKERSPEIEAVEEGQLLVDELGLRSLDLARIIAKLEMKLGVDPFAKLVPITSIRTAGDLCAAYARCFEAIGASQDAGEPSAVSTATPRREALEAQRELRRQARGE